MCSGLASSSFSTTNGTYPWLVAIHIFRNGYPSHDGYHKRYDNMHQNKISENEIFLKFFGSQLGLFVAMCTQKEYTQ
jgi:hypothetical protein